MQKGWIHPRKGRMPKGCTCRGAWERPSQTGSQLRRGQVGFKGRTITEKCPLYIDDQLECALFLDLHNLLLNVLPSHSDSNKTHIRGDFSAQIRRKKEKFVLKILTTNQVFSTIKKRKLEETSTEFKIGQQVFAKFFFQKYETNFW